MATTGADHYRAKGVWPTRPMTPLEPLSPRPLPRPSRARRALAIAVDVIVSLVLLGAIGGLAYFLVTRQT
jgi:hypothetical protein